MERFINPLRMAEYAREHKIGKGESNIYKFIFAAGVLFWIVGIVFLNLVPPEYAPKYDPAWLATFDLAFVVVSVPLIIAVGWVANTDGKDFWYRFTSVSFSLTALSLVVGAVCGALIASLSTSGPAEVYTLKDFYLGLGVAAAGALLQYVAMRRAAR